MYKLNYFLILFFISLASLWIGTSCTKEDLSNCNEDTFTLVFEYSHNTEYTDLLASQVQNILVAVYNENEILHDLVYINESEIKSKGGKSILLPQGKYTFVAWGGSKLNLEDDYLPDFSAASPQIEVNSTPLQRLNDFKLSLLTKSVDLGEEGDVRPLLSEYSSLFYGAQTVEYSGGSVTTKIPLIKNTNKISLAVTGLDNINLPDGPLGPTAPKVFILGKNGNYNWKNEIDILGPVINYRGDASVSSDTLRADINILRMVIKDHHVGTNPLASPIWIKIQDPVTKKDILPCIDLLEVLMQIKDTNGNYVYQEQASIDRQDKYEFSIRIESDLSVSISVNGWEIVNSKPDIE